MSNKWRAVGPVALIAAGLLVGGGAAEAADEPVQLTPEEMQAQAKDFGQPAVAEAAQGDVGSRAPGSGDGLSAAALPPGLCYATTYGDANEPADTLLDATSYSLGHDCPVSDWYLNVVTADNWASPDLLGVDIAIDSDRNLNTGCGGTDHYYIGWFELDSSAWFAALRTPNCDSTTWTFLDDEAALFRPGNNQVTFVVLTSRFAPVPTLRWQSTISHVNDSILDFMPDAPFQSGGFRTAPGNPCGGRCFFLANSFAGGAADVYFRDPQPATELIYGDWNGDGIDSVGYRNGTSFVLKNEHAATPPDMSFQYGRTTDKVLVGDWDGDGTDSLAVRRGGTYYISNTLGSGVADRVVTYGRPTDVVLVGDWDGDGVDTLAVRRGATYYIKNTIAGGAADAVVTYGRATDVTFAGDWDGDGVDTLAVRRGATYYIKNTIAGGAADTVVTYGRATDVTFVGDWNADGVDSLGVRR